MSNRRTALLLSSLALLLATAPIAAASHKPSRKSESHWYTVAILVFRYDGPDVGKGETWPARVPAPPINHAIYPPSVATGAYAASAQLPGIMERSRMKLQRAKGYSPVLAMAWQQPAGKSAEAKAVSLTPVPSISPSSASVSSPAVASSAAASLTGTVKLLVSHNVPAIALDLRLCEPQPTGVLIQAPPSSTRTHGIRTPSPESRFQAYGVAEPASSTSAAGHELSSPSRRQCFLLHQRAAVKFARLQYFDNPIFGALVVVNKAEPPVKQQHSTTGP